MRITCSRSNHFVVHAHRLERVRAGNGGVAQGRRAIPLGTKVKIQTLDGKRVSGTLMRVDDRVAEGEAQHAAAGSRGR